MVFCLRSLIFYVFESICVRMRVLITVLWNLSVTTEQSRSGACPLQCMETKRHLVGCLCNSLSDSPSLPSPPLSFSSPLKSPHLPMLPALGLIALTTEAPPTLCFLPNGWHVLVRHTADSILPKRMTRDEPPGRQWADLLFFLSLSPEDELGLLTWPFIQCVRRIIKLSVLCTG